MTPPQDRPPSTELPTALVRVWHGAKRSSDLEIPAELLDGHPDVHAMDSGWLGVLPEAGAPEIFDRAVRAARRITSALAADGIEARAVVIPGRTRVDAAGNVQRIPEPLQGDVESKPPELESAQVAVAAEAAAVLEHRRVSVETIQYEGPSGEDLTFEVLGDASPWPPWRNPEIRGRVLDMLKRPETGDVSARLLDHPFSRLEGVLGSGKSRLVAEAITDLYAIVIWTHGDLPLAEQLRLALHSGGLPGHADAAEAIAEVLAADPEWYAWQESATPSLPSGTNAFERLFRQVTARLGRPVLWVYDDMHRLEEKPRELLTELVGSAELGRSLRMIWIGRPGTKWPAGAQVSPTLVMPPWTEASFHTLTEQLAQQLDLPEHLVGLMREQATGSPFAAEEAVTGFDLKPRGGTSHPGDEQPESVPTRRLICHVFAECARLGDIWPLMVLAAVRRAVPADELRTAASLLGAPAARGWADPHLAAGLLVETDSPWGMAVDWSNRLFGSSLRATLSAHDIRRLSVQVGALLDARSVRREARQDAWQLLSGSEAAVDSLLERLRSEDAEPAPGEDLIKTISSELAAHRRRNGDAEREFSLLRHLLRCALSQHRLSQFTSEIERAKTLATGDADRVLALTPVLVEHYQHRGELHRALEATRDALRLAPAEDMHRRILLMVQIGRLLARMNEHDSAHMLFSGLHRLLPEGENASMRATCSFHLGNLEMHAGRLDQALLFHQQSLAIRRQVRDARAAGESFCAIGTVLQAQGRFPAALRSFEGALALLEPLEHPGDVAFALTGIGRIKTRLGDFTGAGAALNRALDLRKGAGERIGQALVELLVAENLLEMARATQAIQLLREAHFRLRLARLDRYVADALQLLGRALLSLNQPTKATEQLEAAERVHRRSGDIQSARLDLSWRLRAAMATSHRSAARPLLDRLVAEMQDSQGQDLKELIDYRIYCAYDWLERVDETSKEAELWLKRANAELLRRAERLEPRQRHRYLSEIHEHREILDRAAHLI
jgi:tetratricopeptide (TPR) repeat protein